MLPFKRIHQQKEENEFYLNLQTLLIFLRIVEKTSNFLITPPPLSLSEPPATPA